MEDGMAVSVKYWVSTDSPVGFPDLQGVDEFRIELAREYATLVRGRPAGGRRAGPHAGPDHFEHSLVPRCAAIT